MRRLLVLLLIFALLAPTLPAKAETSYYALSFDGEDDYVAVDINTGKSLSVIVFAKVNKIYTSSDPNKGFQPFVSKHMDAFKLHAITDLLRLSVVDNTSNVYSLSGGSIAENEIVMFAGVVDGTTVKTYRDGVLYDTKEMSTYILDDVDVDLLYFGKRGPSDYQQLDGNIYLVLIYSRALSDPEIQQIYNDPTNPPTDGLILFYAPDSVDTANGKWLDKSGNGNDGTIYGATAERVSIPRLYVYDANTSEQIAYANVSLTLYFNNTTTGLIPSIPILPWNETVTLNVSATNYESRTISTWTGVDLISVYLAQDTVQLSVPSEFNYTFVDLATLNVSANVSLEKMLSLFHHWPGGSLLDGLFRLNVSQFIKDIFTFDISVESHNFSWVGMLITGIIWFGAELFAWFYFKNPIPVIALGRVMYEGMAKFSTPAFEILQIPIRAFFLYMGYLTIKMMFEKWSGER